MVPAAVAVVIVVAAVGAVTILAVAVAVAVAPVLLFLPLPRSNPVAVVLSPGDVATVGLQDLRSALCSLLPQ